MIEKIFNDVIMINSDLHFDSRGSFLESYNKDYFSSLGVEIDFIQDNISYSLLKNTIRGLHYQTNKFEQSKFVYVISGSIFDVFIDARPNSDSFGMFSSVILDSPEKGILIPKGYLHGFCTLTDNTVVGYKVDNLYNKEKPLCKKSFKWNFWAFNVKIKLSFFNLCQKQSSKWDRY